MKALLDLKFRIFWGALWGLICVLMTPAFSLAGEANLVIPELSQEQNTLLLAGIVICLLGMVFGYYQFTQVKKLPAHPSMLDVSQTIYETCDLFIQQAELCHTLRFYRGLYSLLLWISQKMPIEESIYSDVDSYRHLGLLQCSLVASV